MTRIYILLIEADEGKAFKFDSADHPDVPVGIYEGQEVKEFRFIVELIPHPFTDEDARERYYYLVDEGYGIILKVCPKVGHKYYSSIPWDISDDVHGRTKQILEAFDNIEDFVVNKLEEE